MTEQPKVLDLTANVAGEVEPIHVRKSSGIVMATSDQLAVAEAHAAALRRYMDASPDQREQWEREAEQQRAAERAAAPRVELTLDALLAKLGWTRAYAEHVVQPYCTCEDTRDGWESCDHARDEGLR